MFTNFLRNSIKTTREKRLVIKKNNFRKNGRDLKKKDHVCRYIKCYIKLFGNGMMHILKVQFSLVKLTVVNFK
jgi:hypothetical protein